MWKFLGLSVSVSDARTVPRLRNAARADRTSQDSVVSGNGPKQTPQTHNEHAYDLRSWLYPMRVMHRSRLEKSLLDSGLLTEEQLCQVALS